MIYTVTLNPALDRELTVPAILHDTVLRATQLRVDCGGKGFNVSRAVRALGGESMALGFVGGKTGEILAEALAKLGIATNFVWVGGETRTNVVIVGENAGTHIKVNESGPTIQSAEIDQLLEKVRSLAQPNDWWVLGGSLPKGVPSDMYATLTNMIQAQGAKVILDTSGEALRLGCQAHPFLIKPNDVELAELGQDDDLLAMAKAVQAGGVANIIVTLGKDGAMWVGSGDILQYTPPPIAESNPIGAGDALVGGVVWGLNAGIPLQEALIWGIASGTAAASLPGTEFGTYEQVKAFVEQTLPPVNIGNE